MRPVALCAAAACGGSRQPSGLRPPGAVELPGGRRRRARAERRTVMIGVAALATTGAVLGGEVVRVWRRGSAPLPAETHHVMVAAERAARPTGELAAAAYRGASPAETARLRMAAS